MLLFFILFLFTRAILSLSGGAVIYFGVLHSNKPTGGGYRAVLAAGVVHGIVLSQAFRERRSREEALAERERGCERGKGTFGGVKRKSCLPRAAASDAGRCKLFNVFPPTDQQSPESRTYRQVTRQDPHTYTRLFSAFLAQGNFLGKHHDHGVSLPSRMFSHFNTDAAHPASCLFHELSRGKPAPQLKRSPHPTTNC